MTRAIPPPPPQSPFSGHGSGSGTWFHFHASGVALVWIYPFGKGEKTRRGDEVAQGTSSRPARELLLRAARTPQEHAGPQEGQGKDLPGP